MILGKKVTVVLPAYNAELTLRRTYEEIPKEIVDDVILVDDFSKDRTLEVAKELKIYAVSHSKNSGYGANQKTCYREALARGADIVVMVHPDYQYSPKLIPAMAGMIASGLYDAVLASRILGTGALKGGMPFYKYVSNRFLTFVENLFLGQKLSEYHSGYRAFSKEVLAKLPLENNSDDFIFDNEMIAQAVHFNYQIGEISCPTRYDEDSSSINFSRSVKYGLGVLKVSALFLFDKLGLIKCPLFQLKKKTVEISSSHS